MMGCEKEIYETGLFYRKEQLGIYLAKMHMYINMPNALQTCIRKAQHEFEVMSDHLTHQNIQDGIRRTNAINKAIARDANQSPHYLIFGERKIVKLNNGLFHYDYVENVKIIL